MTDHAISRSLMKALQADCRNALDAIAAKHGVTLRQGRGQFGPHGRLTFDVLPLDASGAAITPEASAFRTFAEQFGLKPDDLGRTITMRGTVYTIVGLRPSAPKYPIIVAPVNGGRAMCFQTPAVVAALARSVAS